jgi:PKD repeat protein
MKRQTSLFTTATLLIVLFGLLLANTGQTRAAHLAAPTMTRTRTRTPTGTLPTPTRTATGTPPTRTRTPTRTPTPVVDFTGTPRQGAAPLAVSFAHGQDPFAFIQCTWTFGDGQTTSMADACFGTSHTYTVPGVYTVSFSYRFIGGSLQTITKTNYIAVSSTSTATPTLTGGPLGWQTISGTVRNASGVPIAGAIVSCTDSAWISTAKCSGNRTTAADGTYSFGQVFIYEIDFISVHTAAAGYASQTIQRSGSQAFANPVFNFDLSVTTNTLTPTPSCETAIYTLYGRVYDAATGQGLANATVWTTTDIGAAPNTTTNADGTYSLVIDNSYHGCHIRGLSAWADGYQQVNIQGNWQDWISQPNRDFALVRSGTPTATRTNTPIGPTFTPTRTRTIGPTFTTTFHPTRTRTRTPLPPTATPTPATGTCSPAVPVSAPFTKDGAGTSCWQVNNISSHINSWNLTTLTVNGVDFTNQWVPVGSLPPKINGYWYIYYNSAVSFGHFEAR